MAKSVLDIMDEQIQRAKEVSASGGTYKPIFFRLTPSSKKGISPNQEAVIRPLFDLDQVVVMAMHRQYNEAEPTRSINAVCARELGQKCKYCELAMTDKKMAASLVFVSWSSRHLARSAMCSTGCVIMLVMSARKMQAIS